jgi:hypothetical protein
VSSTSDPVKQAARRLRNADPQAFADFIAAMEQWTADLLIAMTNAPDSHIFLAQGQARAARGLLRILNECHLEPKPKPGAT